MRSSSEIEGEIEIVKQNIEKLTALSKAVSNISTLMFGLSNDFIEAGTAIEESGDLYGVPFDNGKTKEEGIKFQKVSNSLYEIDAKIKKIINDLSSDLESLEAELLDARERERKASLSQNSSSNSTQKEEKKEEKTNKNRAKAKPLNEELTKIL